MRRRLPLLLLLGACGGEDKPRPGPEPPRRPGVVAFASDQGAGLDIYVRDSDGEPRRLTNGRRDEFSPAFSPDGRVIAYRVNPPRGDEGEIWTMAADGSGKRNLTRSRDVADWSPAFSPDGRRIAYMSSAGGSHELWLMGADGSGKRQLTRSGELSEYPAWSPDGRALAFSGMRGGNFEVVRTDLDGRERKLTDHPAADKWPAWSPDGRRIAFVSDRDGDDDVFVMNADGSGVRNLTRGRGLSESHPVWTPDGRLSYLEHGESGPVRVRIDDYALPVDAVFVFSWAPRRPA